MCDCCAELAERVSNLETQLDFTKAIYPTMSAVDVVRTWFKYHKTLNPRLLEQETKDLYSAQVYRMATWRMYKRGELRKVRLGVYERVGYIT